MEPRTIMRQKYDRMLAQLLTRTYIHKVTREREFIFAEKNTRRQPEGLTPINAGAHSNIT